MEDQGLVRCGPCCGDGYGALPAVASGHATGCLVLVGGLYGTPWVVLLDGDFPVDSILCDGLYRSTRPMVVPNLFEDVGFFDSFKPVWGWQENKKQKSKKSKKAAKAAAANSPATEKKSSATTAADAASIATTATPSSTENPAPAPAIATAVPTATTTPVVKKSMAATVEEADDE